MSWHLSCSLYVGYGLLCNQLACLGGGMAAGLTERHIAASLSNALCVLDVSLSTFRNFFCVVYSCFRVFVWSARLYLVPFFRLTRCRNATSRRPIACRHNARLNEKT